MSGLAISTVDDDLDSGGAARAYFRRRNEDELNTGTPRITPKFLQAICKKNDQYSTPYLNDKLYLHFQGLPKLENLEEYTGVRALWLENNCISVIEGLSHMAELRCLYLHHNVIRDMSGLATLTNLVTVNLGYNMIQRVCGLEGLVHLNTLTLDHNRISSVEDLAALRGTPVAILDLKNNSIEDEKVIQIFEEMPNLGVLELQGNKVVNNIKRYRKELVSRLKGLNYLDDRPVFADERRLTAAWLRGGPDEEQAEKVRMKEEERAKRLADLEAFEKQMEEFRIKKDNQEALAAWAASDSTQDENQVPLDQQDFAFTNKEEGKEESWLINERDTETDDTGKKASVPQKQYKGKEAAEDDDRSGDEEDGENDEPPPLETVEGDELYEAARQAGGGGGGGLDALD